MRSNASSLHALQSRLSLSAVMARALEEAPPPTHITDAVRRLAHCRYSMGIHLFLPRYATFSLAISGTLQGVG